MLLCENVRYYPVRSIKNPPLFYVRGVCQRKHSVMNEAIIYFMMTEITRLWKLINEKDKTIEALERELDIITDPLTINDIQNPN